MKKICEDILHFFFSDTSSFFNLSKLLKCLYIYKENLKNAVHLSPKPTFFNLFNILNNKSF